MSELEIRLFGYPELLIDGHPLQFKRRKTTALLAYLSIETSQAGSSPLGISRENLADLFWPDCSQAQAGAYLRQALWDCSSLAGDQWIVRSSGMVRLDFTAGIQADANQFESLFHRWKIQGSSTDVLDQWMDEITSLYRSHFLAGFTIKACPAFDHWQSLQAETLRMHMEEILERSIQLSIDRGETLQAENNVRKWLAWDSTNETAHRALMTILEQTGRHSAAIRQFDICRAILKYELEVDPESQTLDLYSKLRDHPSAGLFGRPVHPGEKAAPKPSGTVTFVFTDIQSSTHLWEHQKEAMRRAFQRHEEIVRSAMVSHGGYVYKMIGDAFQVAFATAQAALLAALQAQHNLHSENWDERTGEIKVRMALHMGVTEERGDDYLGPILNRVARLLNAGHGGQVLLTEAVYHLVREELPDGYSLQYLGEYHLKDLIAPEKAYQLIGPGLPADFPPLKAEGGKKNKLPYQSQAFIGREVELARIHGMLSDPACRLVTLLGIGGCGKTRLAVRAAEESQEFADGVCFCTLENVGSVQGLILAIAEEVNLSLNPAPGGSITLEMARDQLFQYLAGKQLLLILDNFEQVVFCAGLVGDLLEAARDVKVLVTSRQRLNLPGEWLMEIGGLSYPAGESHDPPQNFSAVQLFIKTAERNSGLHPGLEDWPAILKICRLLEGIPLGIEMAAALTRTLSCAEIGEEIERNQDFLVTSWRGMPERHRTLRAVFEHSWRLLSESEQEIFSQLSIFQSNFSREAALVIANAPLSIISALVDKALIRRISSGRFEIHPLLRRYAGEKLSANGALLAETSSRMADYYTNWLIRMDEKLRGKEHLAGLVAIRGEMLNLQSSLVWLVQQVDVERLSRIMPAWILYHIMNDPKYEMVQAGQPIIELIDRLRSRAGTREVLETVLLALVDAAVRYFCIGQLTENFLQSYHEESMRLIRTLPDHAYKAHALLLNCLGASTLQPAEAVAYIHESIRLFNRYDNPWGSAMAYMAVGDVYTFANLVPDEARAAYTRGLQEFTRVGSDWGRALCIAGLMYLERMVGNLEESYQYGTGCLSIFMEMASFERMVSIRDNLGEISEILGRFQEAAGYYQANLAHFTRRGDEAGQQYYRRKLIELADKSAG